jgi:hypothetical protein
VFTSEKRLVSWRNFRKTLEWKDLTAAAVATAEWWKDIPLEEGFSTPWATDAWPDPWNLISNGPLDHTLTSVAIAYTLWMTAITDDKLRIELAVINDLARRQVLLTVLIDTHLLINYNAGEVTDMSQITNDVEVLATYGYNTFKTRIKA